jgi:glycosyltransferase involved in cell wall biosynthesis
MAAYNAADTIGEALESVFAQTAPPYEVLVCDDGSTDDLDGALRPFRDRLVLLRQPNRGFAAARNTLLWNATGDFAVFLDADDAFLPERLEAMGDLGRRDPSLDILHTDALIETGGEVVGRFSERVAFPATGQVEAMFRACYLLSPAIRLSSLLAIGGFHEPLRIAADWDCWLQVLLHGGRAGQVPDALMRYRLNPGSLSDDRPASLQERVVLLARALEVPDLTAPQRAELRRQLEIRQHAALLLQADAAVVAGRRSARWKYLRAATLPGVAPRARLSAFRRAVQPRRDEVAQRLTREGVRR